MSDPIEPPDPDLDTLTRADLAELAHLPAAAVADVLDDWLLRAHGITSSGHNVGLFLDLLAAAGFQVTPIDPGPPIGSLLPPPKE